jgi:hypothetical protein
MPKPAEAKEAYAMADALSAETASAAPACPGGQVATAGGCVADKVAAKQMDTIVRDAMANFT